MPWIPTWILECTLMALQAQRLSFSFQFQLEFIWEFASRKFFNKRFLYFCRKNLLNLKEFAHFAVNAPLSICEQFIQIIFPCRDIGPATATLDSRPRHWTRDRDFGLATRDMGPATRDPRLLVKLDAQVLFGRSFRTSGLLCQRTTAHELCSQGQTFVELNFFFTV